MKNAHLQPTVLTLTVRVTISQVLFLISVCISPFTAACHNGLLSASSMLVGIFWLSSEQVKALKCLFSWLYTRKLYNGCLVHSLTPFLRAMGKSSEELGSDPVPESHYFSLCIPLLFRV